MHWADPLNYNGVSFFFDIDSETREKQYQLSYVNQKNLLNWGVLAESDVAQTVGVGVNKNSYRGLLKYHYFRKNDLDLFLTLSSGLGVAGDKFNFDNYFGVDLVRKYFNVIGYDPFDYQSAYAEIDFDVDGLEISLLANHYQQYVDDYYFGVEFFGQYTFRDFFETGVLNSGRRRLYPTLNRAILSAQSPYFLSGVGGLKVLFETEIFNEYFPIGLRRYAFEGFAGVTKFDGSLLNYNLLYGGSVEMELILMKKFIQRIEFSLLESSTGDAQIFLGLTDSF